MTDRRVTKTQIGGSSQRPNGPVPHFNYMGIVVTGALSPPYKFRGFKVVTRFLATVTVPDPSVTMIGIYKNKDFSVSIADLIIAGSADEAELEGPFRFLAGEYLQMRIDACGTTGSGILVQPQD